MSHLDILPWLIIGGIAIALYIAPLAASPRPKCKRCKAVTHIHREGKRWACDDVWGCGMRRRAKNARTRL